MHHDTCVAAIWQEREVGGYMGLLIIVILHCAAGEVGGYIGLLIGASVLTLCEILDLLIYNLLLKCVDYVYRLHAVNMHSKSPPEEKAILNT